MLACAALAVLCALLSPGETRRDTWPDGRLRAEYEVQRLEGGREVRSGAYRSWHANGQLESEGSFADDRETGRWKLFHPSGQRAAEGSFARGERAGVWETFHANGARQSKGRYEKDRRAGEWSFWSAEGVKDALNSGEYAAVALRLPDGRALSGQRLDGTLHGEWKSTWPDGAPMLEGGFARGRREGAWTFHHPDGRVSSLLSGLYQDGWRSTTAAAPQAEPGAPAPIEPGVLGWPRELEAITAELEAWLALDAQKHEAARRDLAAQKARPSWLAAGPRAVPVVLRRMQACDPDDPAARAALGRLEAMLRSLCAGHELAPLGALGPTPAEARALVQAWSSLWAATRDDAWFWLVELPLTAVNAPDELLRERPFELAFGALRSVPAPPAVLARRAAQGARGLDGPLTAALDWLERSQLPDGHWKAGPALDGERSWEHYEGGVTALALLALLGASRTPADSPSVTGAIGWLLRHQDPASGCIRGALPHQSWMYTHAISTLALCEAHALHPTELLKPRVQHAVDVLFAAQNPFSAWRYNLPGDGDNDTSVTAWATAALFVAREAGFAGDFAAAFEGALNWIDSATDPERGHVGYDSAGTTSARSEFNQAFAPEKGEAMTAAALFVRRLLGVPLTAALIPEQIGILRARPPRWDPASNGIDEYYFYYGAQALALCGEPARSSWLDELREIARAQSGNASERGSWDPLGAWAYCGGRVYSTALLALALEAPFRYALADAEPGKPDKKKKR